MNAPSPLNRQNYRVPLTSPIGYGVTNLGGASQPVIGPNGQRMKLMFFNPNPAVTIWITPANQLATKGGGSIPLYSGGGPYVVEGENVNAGWNAIADSAVNNGLTILEFV
jgi:hypothetical protein